jgi:hypothetical protein
MENEAAGYPFSLIIHYSFLILNYPDGLRAKQQEAGL